MDSFAAISEAVQTGGLVVLLLLIVWGALKEWWVPGVTHRRALQEAEKWKNVATESIRTTERATFLSDKAVRGVESRNDGTA